MGSDARTLSELVAVTGSAFTFDAYDACTNILNPGNVRKRPWQIFTGILGGLGCGFLKGRTPRIDPAHIPNFMLGLKQGPDATMPLPKDPQLQFQDSGFKMNLPVPPLLRPERQLDAMVIVDVSEDDMGGELAKVEAWARHNGYAQSFPIINYDGITERPMSIFESSALTVVYIPLRNCSSWGRPSAFIAHKYHATQFRYSNPMAVEEITEGVGCSLRHGQQEYLAAMRRVLQRRKQRARKLVRS